MDHVEIARSASARGEVVLRERRASEDGPGSGDPVHRVLELRVNGVFVMDTLETRTERALASAALAQVETPASVLVGGLGLGYTLHEVLADRRVERLVVVEVEEALIGWMRDGTVPHGPAFLADQRLSVVAADIRVAVQEAGPATYDLVLLDVDNGPGFLVHDTNAAVYRTEFLAEVDRVLRPGGVVVVWSSSVSPDLAEALTTVFGEAVAIPLEVSLQARAEEYWLYLAHRRRPRDG